MRDVPVRLITKAYPRARVFPVRTPGGMRWDVELRPTPTSTLKPTRGPMYLTPAGAADTARRQGLDTIAMAHGLDPHDIHTFEHTEPHHIQEGRTR